MKKNKETKPEQYKIFFKEKTPLYHHLIEEKGLSLLDALTVKDLSVFAKSDEDALILFLGALFESRNLGNICLKINSAHYLKDFQPQKYPAIIGTADSKIIPPLPVLYYKSEKNTYYYFHRYFTGKTQFDRKMNELKNKPAKEFFPKDISDILKKPINQEGKQLNAEQINAIEMVFKNSFTIVSGGPGTGKTTIIQTLLECLVKTGFPPEKISIAAPTGRAAQRIKETLSKFEGISPKTIHRLLEFQPHKNSFYYGKNNFLPCEILILDEVSMVDISLMTNLLQAVSENTKVVFLGDKDQLPSVEAGAVLSNLIELLEINQGVRPYLAKLTESNRSIGSIWKTAQKINQSPPETDIQEIIKLMNSDLNQKEGIKIQKEKILFSALEKSAGEPLDTSNNHCYWLERKPLGKSKKETEGKFILEEMRKILKEWFAFLYLPIDIELIAKITSQNVPVSASELNQLFKILERGKILTFTKSSLLGKDWINQELKALLFEAVSRDLGKKNNIIHPDWFSGLPVMITRNNNDKKLYNGNMGMVINENLYFKVEGEYKEYPVNFITDKDYAFAMTVHKSQGSEYDNVLLVLPGNEDTPLLSREIIYTGLTRAKKGAFIYGTKEIFQQGVQTRIIRESGPDLSGENT